MKQELAYNAQWNREHPLKRKEWDARRRAKKYSVLVEKLDYAVILARDNGLCHICNLPVAMEDLTFDHIIPLAKGGPHTYENIAVAHYVCNQTKHATIM